MKRVFKSRIFQFIITAIIFTGIGVFAEDLINANQVTYTDKNNVEKRLDVVLDDLYTGLSNYMNIERFGTAITDYSQGNIILSRSQSLTLNKGKYLVLDSVSAAYAQSSTYTNGHQEVTDDPVTCEDNTKCTATKLYGYWNGVQATTAVTGSSKVVASGKQYLYFVEIKENNTTITATATATNNLNNGAIGITIAAIPLND